MPTAGVSSRTAASSERSSVHSRSPSATRPRSPAQARGFILGAAVAAELGVGFVAIRKEKGLFPGPKVTRRTEADYRGRTCVLRLQREGRGDEDRITPCRRLRGAREPGSRRQGPDRGVRRDVPRPGRCRRSAPRPGPGQDRSDPRTRGSGGPQPERLTATRNLRGPLRQLMGMGDDKLVSAALAGDPAAFATLVDQNRARVQSIVELMVGEDAEDIVQEALLRAYLGLSQLRDPARFTPGFAGSRERREDEAPAARWRERVVVGPASRRGRGASTTRARPGRPEIGRDLRS